MRKVTRRTVLGNLALGSVALMTGCSPNPAVVGGGAVTDGASGRALFGAYISPADHPIEVPTNAAAARDFGRPMRINGRFMDFPDSFPDYRERATRMSGQIPMVTWSPIGLRLADIANGRYDGILRARASDTKRFETPLLVRFAHEMNGDWYSWSSQNSLSATLGNTPQAYVDAWRHVRRIFDHVGAANVSWVWCPNAIDYPPDNDARMYYPGSDYVDWIGLDVYVDDQSRQQRTDNASFASVTKAAARKFDQRKPLVIAEFGFSGSTAFRVAQFESVPAVVSEVPQLRALMYFARNEFSPRSSPEVLAAARKMAVAPQLAGGLRGPTR